jgi:hypothetical protein
MGFDAIPIRTNGQIADVSWWNTIRQYLINYFPGLDIQTLFTIANNQSAAANITDLVLDKTTYGFYKIAYTYYRSTNTNNQRVFGYLFAHFNASTDAWTLDDKQDGGDIGGVEFSISGEQIKYTSDNMSGTGYVGKLTYKIENAFNIE